MNPPPLRTLSSKVVEPVFLLLVTVFLVGAPIVQRVVTHGAALLLLLGLAVGWRGLRRLSPAAWWLYGGFLLYFLSALASLPNNHDWDFAGWRFERYHPFLFSLFLMGLLAARQRPLLPRLVWISLLTAVIMALYGSYEYFWLHYDRAGITDGVFGFYGLRVNTFAHVAYMHALILLSAALIAPVSRRLRFLFASGALLGIGAGLTTVSRGATLGLAMALLVLLGIYVSRLAPRGKAMRVALATSLAVVLLMAPFFASHQWESYLGMGIRQLQSLGHGSHEFNSVAGRIQMWQGGLLIWRDHPWIGTGIGDGQDDLRRLVREGVVPMEHARLGHHFHNNYVEMLATTGLVGLASMLLGILILPLRFFWRSLTTVPPSDGWSPVAGLAGIAVLTLGAVYGMTNCWLCNRGLPYVLILTVLLLGSSGLFYRREPGR